jgi:hypothetical protein
VSGPLENLVKLEPEVEWHEIEKYAEMAGRGSR